MSRLLNAEFSRLFKSRIFWICAAAPFMFAILRLMESHWKFEDKSALVRVFFGGSVFVTICCAVFSSIFISGTENTVRNKIVVGHKKTHIHFTNVIVSCAAAVIYQLIYTLPIFIVSFVSFAAETGFSEKTKSAVTNFKEFQFGIGDALFFKLIETLAIIVMAAIFAFLMTLIRKNVVAVVASALIILGFLIVDENFDNEINIRKSWLYLCDEETGEPLYQDGERERILNEISTLQAIRNFIPIGQMDTISHSYLRSYLDFQLEKPDMMVYICIGEFLLINAAGAVIYRKCDLK